MERIIIVDGYNLMYCVKKNETEEAETLEDARYRMIEQLKNYAVFQKQDVILVFDGAGKKEDLEEYKHLQVVFTKKEETADTYIEKIAAALVRKDYGVTVVTSDYEEQKSIFGSGAIRLSSREFLLDLQDSKDKEKKYFRAKSGQRNLLDQSIDARIVGILKTMRRG